MKQIFNVLFLLIVVANGCDNQSAVLPKEKPGKEQAQVENDLQTYLNLISIYYCTNEGTYTLHSPAINGGTYYSLQDARIAKTNWAVGAMNVKAEEPKPVPVPCGVEIK